MIDNTPRISADVFCRLTLKAVEKSSINTGSNSESKSQRTPQLAIPSLLYSVLREFVHGMFRKKEIVPVMESILRRLEICLLRE